MPETIEVFLSCALGAFIGSLIGLQFHHLWIGIAAGFPVGCLAVKFSDVINAFKATWREVVAWRPDVGWWKAYSRLVASIIGSSTSIAILLLLYCVVFVSGSQDPSKTLARLNLKICFLVVLGFVGFVSAFLSYMLYSPSADSFTPMINHMEAFSNPVALYFWHIPKIILFGIVEVARGLSRFANTLKTWLGVPKRFCVTFFRLIHSKLRLLCGVDAAIGAAVGYYFGNPLVGFIAGGLLGVLNFEFVSIRYYKLFPMERSLAKYFR